LVKEELPMRRMAFFGGNETESCFLKF